MNRLLVVVALSLLVFGFSSEAFADQIPSSSNYSLPESYVGPGGAESSSSNNFTSTGTTGDLGVGNSNSANYNTQSGFNTTADPRLTLIINTSTANFGALSTTVASTATSTFSVLNYTSYGYGVYTIGAPPSMGSHALTGMPSTTASQVGTEQFGINLKANTSPITFGANPVQVPSGSFSSGAATSGYNSANNFRYVSGEQIAGAAKSSGETDYTISYIINTSITTPGGTYTGAQSLVVIGTY
ncbi:MAG: hypothetical protein WDN27_03910 [Candidatus Saccharibacteria bacterium]